MAQLTASFICQSLGLPAPAQETQFSTLTTDSRQISPGCLFVALVGEKMDAHDFIEQAIQSGAKGILAHRLPNAPLPSHVQIFLVSDSLQAFRKLAQSWRNQFKIPVIGVVGSVGKTTTKELTAALLRGKFPNVLKTDGSQNGFVGIPMTLMRLRPEHQAAVIEIGIDEVGAMSQHLPIVEAQTIVCTAIGPEHLEKLIDLHTVAHEECLALEYACLPNRTAIINLDDEWITRQTSRLHPLRSMSYTLSDGHPKATLHGSYHFEKQTLDVNGLGGKTESFSCSLPGEHNARNLLAAITVAHSLGLTASEMRQGLSTFQAPDGRSQIKTIKDGSQVVCDYYNSNPTSLTAALHVLKSLPGPRVACLGDMLELGPDEETFHREMAPTILQSQIERLFLFGPRMKALAEELRQQAPKLKVEHFEKQSDMISTFLKDRPASASILIKGSRSMKMEELWKKLNDS